jgi:hypothetical protein
VTLTLGGIAAVAWWPLGLAALASWTVYLLVVLVESVRLGRRGAPVWRLPMVFAAIHVGFGWGYLRELAAGLSRWPTGVVAVLRWSPGFSRSVLAHRTR